ncbi:MAG: hypothetical protein A4E66_01232 [Syntrophus sp. PtaB.Bin001]|nr:MAG: hypothetical protein A4E66_01232 [Syntrophus sp. PtaB.Bin001]
MPGLLQFAVWLFVGALLAPVAAVPPLRRLEGHLGEASARLARHDFVATLRDLAETGGAAVEGKANCVHDCRLARPRRAGNGKDAVGCVIGMGKIDLPLAG